MNDRFQTALDKLRAAGQLRILRDPGATGDGRPAGKPDSIGLPGQPPARQGQPLVNLSSNDYMGVAAHPTLWREFLERELDAVKSAAAGFPSGASASIHVGAFGGGACSSRLLTGNHPAHVALEERLAGLYSKLAGEEKTALVFNSGYHANVGILPAVTTQRDWILADKLVHASLIEGIRLSAAKCTRFPHNDLDRLEALLERRRGEFDRVFIVTESLFSMDGDFADLPRLAALKARHDALLYLDEAHAVGARGPLGLGVAEELGLAAQVDFLVGTFGKAFASQGAFAITRRTVRDYLVNTMRPLIFSTALPPVSLRWTAFVLEHLLAQTERRRHLQAMGGLLRQRLAEAGWETQAGAEKSGETHRPSHIVPLLVRDNARAMRLSERLAVGGFFALPIRPPSVPTGGERLRLSLTADITPGQIAAFCELCGPGKFHPTGVFPGA